MSWKKRLLVAGIAALLAGCGGSSDPEAKSASDTPATPPTATPYPAAMIEDGAFNYSIFCVACHAPDAKGIDQLGFNLVESEFVGSLTDQQLLEFIIVGRPVEQTKNGVAMPPRGGYPNLTDEQILSIIAYLRSLRTAP